MDDVLTNTTNVYQLNENYCNKWLQVDYKLVGDNN